MRSFACRALAEKALAARALFAILSRNRTRPPSVHFPASTGAWRINARDWQRGRRKLRKQKPLCTCRQKDWSECHFFLISNVRRHGLPAQGRPLSGALPCKKNRLAHRAGQLRQAVILRNPCLNCARKAFWGRGTSPARGSPKLKFHHCSEDNNDEIFAWWLWVFSLWRRRPEPKA